MYSTEQLADMIQNRLSGLYLEREPANLYQPIEYALSSGGKRIRPALCLMACNLFSQDINQAIDPAVGIETFHNFTLLHDDIMDKADTRRGRPTVHKKWNDSTAILSGDAMMIEAYSFFLKLPSHLLSEVLPIFNQTAIEVCEGQQYDMNFETMKEVSEASYLEMIRLKTAVLLAGALKIGALIGGASKEKADLLYQFGINAGMAFQLQDDYLDTFGDAKTFGKRIGGDIVEHKKTYLLIQAIDLAPEKAWSILHRPSISEAEKILEITSLYRELEIDKKVLNAIQHYYLMAIDALEHLGLDRIQKEPLLNFLDQLKGRQF